MKKSIAFICHHIYCEKNRVQFQRMQTLITHYNIYIFSIDEICEDLKYYGGYKHFFPPLKDSIISRLIFIPWVVLKIFNKKRGISLVYTNLYSPALISGFILKLLGFKWVADIWDDPGLAAEFGGLGFKGKIRRLYHKIFSIISKKCIKSADLLILSLHKDILKNYNIKHNNILSLTNGVDLNVANRIRKTFRSNTIFTIIYLGEISEKRDIDTIINAMIHLKTRIDTFRLFLIGDISNIEKNRIKKIIHKSNLKENVVLLGKVNHEEALKFIAQSDVGLCLLAPTVENYNYAYPIKIFEYMALGKVTIATKLKGVEQIIKNGENGFLISPEDSTLLAEILGNLRFNPALRKKIGEKALLDVKKYDWPDINKKIVNALDDFIGNKSG